MTDPHARAPAVRTDERAPARSGSATRDTGPKRILIVEDEPALRDLLSFILEESGYQARGAANGAEALAYCREEPFDLVLLDVMMPVMDGREFLRARGLSCSGAPVIVMSAVRALDVLQQPGVVAFLEKPFDLGEIERLTHAFLE
ncbi:MAG TPA: response regulator [Candidatus Limnocylindrales bacterium]|nr:response regulator [Candidatus Limnocylindrales bacterium]